MDRGRENESETKAERNETDRTKERSRRARKGLPVTQLRKRLPSFSYCTRVRYFPPEIQVFTLSIIITYAKGENRKRPWSYNCP